VFETKVKQPVITYLK